MPFEDQLRDKNFTAPSGFELTVMSGASFSVATKRMPVPGPFPPRFTNNPNLITGDGETGRLMMRMFGWNDPYYAHGSDLQPNTYLSPGGADIIGPNGPGFYNVIRSNYPLPDGASITGVIRSYGAGTGDDYNDFLFNPTTGFTDAWGNTMTGFQFQRGSRDLSMYDSNYGHQSVHFPQLQDNARGWFDSQMEFVRGKTDSAEKGFTITYWSTPQWYTGCDWGEIDTNCSGAGPGCNLDWVDQRPSSRQRCAPGSPRTNPPGQYIYKPWFLGNTNNSQLAMYHKWEGTDRPATLEASATDQLFIEPRQDNPPNPIDMTFRTGIWTFFALRYDGDQVASSNGGESYSVLVAVGTPTGTAATPNGKAMQANFFMYSGDGSDPLVQDEALKEVGNTLWQRGGASNSPWIDLSNNYACGMGIQLGSVSANVTAHNAYWPGMICDFRLYSGALGTGHIRDIYLGNGTV